MNSNDYNNVSFHVNQLSVRATQIQTNKTNIGPNSPTSPIPGRRIPRPAPDQTIRVPKSPPPDDDGLESGIMDPGLDVRKGLILCDESFDRCAGRGLYTRNHSLRDILLQDAGTFFSTGILLVIVKCMRISRPGQTNADCVGCPYHFLAPRRGDPQNARYSRQARLVLALSSRGTIDISDWSHCEFPVFMSALGQLTNI